MKNMEKIFVLLFFILICGSFFCINNKISGLDEKTINLNIIHKVDSNINIEEFNIEKVKPPENCVVIPGVFCNKTVVSNVYTTTYDKDTNNYYQLSLKTNGNTYKTGVFLIPSGAYNIIITTFKYTDNNYYFSLQYDYGVGTVASMGSYLFYLQPKPQQNKT